MSESRDAPASTDLIIRQKCEAMILYGHVAVTHFPRNERHVLGAQIRNCLWSLLRLIVVCNKRYHKKTTLQEIDAELDLLRSMIRLARDMGYLAFRRYEHWARLNDEIGRLLGGWIKAMGGAHVG